MKKKKPYNVKMHFSKRCIERIGFPIDSNRLKSLLVENKLQNVMRESNNKTHWLVPKELLPVEWDKEMVAVYDKVRHEFVTVIFRNPEDNLDHMRAILNERRKV